MNAHEFIDLLQEILDEHCDEDIARIVTYSDAGMLTRDAGLVIRMTSGDEFQVTIVQVRHGRDDEGGP